MFQFLNGSTVCGWVYEYDSTYSINQSISVYTMLSSGSCGLSPNMNQNLTLTFTTINSAGHRTTTSHQIRYYGEILGGHITGTNITTSPSGAIEVSGHSSFRCSVHHDLPTENTPVLSQGTYTVSNGMVHWDTGNATLRCHFWDSVGNYLTKNLVRH